MSIVKIPTVIDEDNWYDIDDIGGDIIVRDIACVVPANLNLIADC